MKKERWNNQMEVKKFKYTLIDPMEALGQIFGVDVTQSSYIKALGDTGQHIMDMILDDNANDLIADILSDYDITDETLEKIMGDNSKVYGLYVGIMGKIVGDVTEIYKEVIDSNDGYIQSLRKNLEDVLEDLVFDEKIIAEELSEIMDEFDNLAGMAVVMISDIMNFIIGLLNGKEIDVDITRAKTRSKKLRDQVNDFDESFNVDLKHPEKVVETDKQLNKYLAHHRKTLKEMMDVLNETEKSYGKKYFKVNTELELNKKFKRSSKCFNAESTDIRGNVFRVRFALYILVWVYNNLYEIGDKCYELNKDSKWVEFEEKQEYVDNMMDHVIEFVNDILDEEPIGKHIQYFTEINVYLNTEKKMKKKNIEKLDDIHFQTNVLTDKISWFSNAEDDKIADTILKLSYMVCVHDTKGRKKITFRTGYKAGAQPTSKQMIEELGRVINKGMKSAGGSLLFKFFIDSDPVIGTNYDTKKNKDLNTGVLAVSFYGFISGDKGIMRFINNMI